MSLYDYGWSRMSLVADRVEGYGGGRGLWHTPIACGLYTHIVWELKVIVKKLPSFPSFFCVVPDTSRTPGTTITERRRLPMKNRKEKVACRYTCILLTLSTITYIKICFYTKWRKCGKVWMLFYVKWILNTLIANQAHLQKPFANKLVDITIIY